MKEREIFNGNFHRCFSLINSKSFDRVKLYVDISNFLNEFCLRHTVKINNLMMSILCILSDEHTHEIIFYIFFLIMMELSQSTRDKDQC